jgi:hypothetical protein
MQTARFLRPDQCQRRGTSLTAATSESCSLMSWCVTSADTRQLPHRSTQVDDGLNRILSGEGHRNPGQVAPPRSVQARDRLRPHAPRKQEQNGRGSAKRAVARTARFARTLYAICTYTLPWRDTKETARRAAFPQLAGRFTRVWQVLGSNQRRLSRRFYRPLPLATRATCRMPPVPGSIARIAQDAARQLADGPFGCDGSDRRPARSA